MTVRAAALAFALLAAGCASLPDRVQLAAPSVADRECFGLYARLDAAAERAGVRDAEADRVDGFPWLRVNRMLAAVAPRARASDPAFAQWLRAMSALDIDASAVELGN